MPNETVKMAGPPLLDSNGQLWPWATGAPVDWLKQSPDAGTIAVVDSGIDATKTSDFGSRILGQVNMTSLSPNSPGDGYGHGTFVGSIAAGAAPGYAGVAPKAELLSIDVMNDQGQATVGDVIKAADWILANKAKYNIKVANFSLHAVNKASILFDPLDQAVEKLWLNGVVVVAASGNYGTAGTPSGVNFAPGNDPFVITVGATDIGTSLGAGDDTAAPFSAYGYTPDGFSKPEIAAPGRYMIGAVPVGSTLTQLKPANVTDPVNGYMQLSGTSFAAPVVAGAAAELLAQHPTWTPDQVKGALMLTATPEPRAAKGSLGVGDVNVASRARVQEEPAEPERRPRPVRGHGSATGRARSTARPGRRPPSPTRRGTRLPGLTLPGRTRHGRPSPGATRPGPMPLGRPLPTARLPGATSPGAMRRGRTRLGPTTPATRPSVTQPTQRPQSRTRRLRGSASSNADCDPTISICEATAAAAAPLAGAVTTVTSGLLP